MDKDKTLKWSCVTGCGACCRLAPEERADAMQALDEQQTFLYLSMVGEDGWCIHFDKNLRRCKIYSDRPSFCKVSNLDQFFDFETSDFDSFAVACCLEHIETTYGKTSIEYLRFTQQFTDIS